MEDLVHSNPSDSDEDDEDDVDFVPGGESDVSEEEDNDNNKDTEVTTNGKSSKSKSGKRKKFRSSKKSSKRSRKNDLDSGDESTDDDFDPSYVHGNGVEPNEGDNEKIEQVDEEAEKKRTDRLWSGKSRQKLHMHELDNTLLSISNFLSGVEQISKKPKSDSSTLKETIVKKVYDFAGTKVEVEEKVQLSQTNGASYSASSSSSTTTITSSSSSSSSYSSSSSSSLVIPSSSSSISNGSTKLTTPGTSGGPPRRQISFLSGNPAQIGLATKPGTKKIGGLQAVLSAIQSKKQKMGTLEKTKLDWQQFKKQEGLDEELQTHVKSKDGYLEKQDFLLRSDLRQFEIEKNLRARSRRNP